MRLKLDKIVGGFSVPGFGTVTRSGLLRPNKVLRDTKGQTYQVAARRRGSAMTGNTGATLGSFRRNFWTWHGVVEWGAERYEFRAAIWRSSYELHRDSQPVAKVKVGVLSDRSLTVADDLDPVLVLFFVSLASITKSYVGATIAN